jgi:hypothetical protein
MLLVVANPSVLVVSVSMSGIIRPTPAADKMLWIDTQNR